MKLPTIRSSSFDRCAARILVAFMLVVFIHHPSAVGQTSDDRPDNVVFIVADGMSVVGMTLARDYLRDTQVESSGLALDPYLTGTVQTFAADSRITDSASSATAYASGVKTYNGAIGMNVDRQPVSTILERAEQRGFHTGLISTARITHATPAAFSAHVPARAQEQEIADQQIRQGIEILLGGGRQFYVGPMEGGVRTDSANIMQDTGYHLVANRAELLSQQELPVLGLFSMSHMAYEIDRARTAEPSLAEMTTWALDRLASQDRPFFMMIEAGRVDHAGHGNDAPAFLHDMLAFDQAVAAALAFARKDGRTLVVITADHETGGLTLGGEFEGGGSGYRYDPTGLAAARSSIEDFGRRLTEVLADRPALPNWIAETLMADFQLSLSEPEQFELRRILATNNDARLQSFLRSTLQDRLARRASVHWSTSGHTAVDVPLFAFGPGAGAFNGSMDNTRVGLLLAEMMGVPLAE
ncbi:MAG: alkaline phosphatase [Rhodothermales bacterium]